MTIFYDIIFVGDKQYEAGNLFDAISKARKIRQTIRDTVGESVEVKVLDTFSIPINQDYNNLSKDAFIAF